jgi:hypothetical protein
MKWATLILIPCLAIATGCATGYTAKTADAGRKQPKQTLLLAEGLVFQNQPGKNPPALVRDESMAFSRAMASGICERLELQGVDCKSIVMAGVQQSDYPQWVAESLDATNAEPAVVPVEAPAKWRKDPVKAAALSSLFSTLDTYRDSAMFLGAPPKTEFPDRVKADKLVFSPDDFTTLFGRSITSIVVLAQGGAQVRRDGSMLKDMGVAVGVALFTAVLTGGRAYAVPGGPIYPWFVKAVAVDTATGEVLWADILVGQGTMATGANRNSQATLASTLTYRCPLFKAEK